MRAVAMHSMRCQTCESELKDMERVQLLVGDTLRKRVDEIDFTRLWAGIEQRIADIRVPWSTRVRAWWEEIQIGFDLRIPALVAAAAMAVLAFAWYGFQSDASQPIDAQQVATADNEAAIESLETSFDTVDVFRDPASNSTILWVSDEGPLRGAMQ